METAPETWEGGVYDEKSDVFSYAIILWRLFGSIAQNKGRVKSAEEKAEIKLGSRGSVTKPLGRVRGSIFLEMQEAKRESKRESKRLSKFVANYTVKKKSGVNGAAGEDGDFVDEFSYLKEQGKYLPPPLQREAIRKVLLINYIFVYIVILIINFL